MRRKTLCIIVLSDFTHCRETSRLEIKIILQIIIPQLCFTPFFFPIFFSVYLKIRNLYLQIVLISFKQHLQQVECDNRLITKQQQNLEEFECCRSCSLKNQYATSMQCGGGRQKDMQSNQFVCTYVYSLNKTSCTSVIFFD